jgi:hypothetical protein
MGKFSGSTQKGALSMTGPFLPTQTVLNPAVYPNSTYTPITKNYGEYQPIDKAKMLQELIGLGASEEELLRLMAAGGVGSNGVKDSRLAHINPEEDRLLRAHGGEGSINPRTGLPQYKYGADTREGGATGKQSGGPNGNGGGGDKGGGKFGGSTQTGATKPGASPIGPQSDKSLPERIGDFFGGPEAYARNMARRTGGVTVPSVPNASPGQIFGAIMGGIPGMLSGPMVASEIYKSFQPGYKPQTGMVSSAIDSMGGWTPGGIEGNTQVGRINDQGDPGQNRGLLSMQQPMQPGQGYLASTPVEPMAPQNGGLLSMQYPGAQVPIGGPTPYSYNRPNYNYWAR